MFKKIITLFLVTAIYSSGHVYAAPIENLAQAKGLTNEEKTELTGTRKQLATTIFSGLSGAIVGLSTLSFYGRPQDHLSNIAIGFALGIIGGAIFTTYRTATKPYDVYDMEAQLRSIKFNEESFQRTVALENTQVKPRIGWQWTF